MGTVSRPEEELLVVDLGEGDAIWELIRIGFLTWGGRDTDDRFERRLALLRETLNQAFGAELEVDLDGADEEQRAAIRAMTAVELIRHTDDPGFPDVTLRPRRGPGAVRVAVDSKKRRAP